MRSTRSMGFVSRSQEIRRSRSRPSLAERMHRSRAMIRTRLLGATLATLLTTTLGILTACNGSGSEEPTQSTADTLKAANVSITLQDENGRRIGQGSGILIAPRLVLTSAHLVAGMKRW